MMKKKESAEEWKREKERKRIEKGKDLMRERQNMQNKREEKTVN